jgi:putative peptidoglycan lipid II flippase
MQFFIQVPMLFKKGFHYYFYVNLKDKEFLKVLAIFIPVAIGLAGSRINVAVDVIMVSFLEERSMTWLDYAFRVMHLPLGLFGIAVGTVALPALSQFVLEKKFPELREATFDALKLVLFLTISTSVIIAFLSYPIIKIIYERGKFTGFDTRATTQALILYMIGVPFMSGIRNLAAVFYAFKDSKTPMYASFASIGVHIALNLVLMWFIGFRSFPLTTSVAALANLVILFYYLPRKIGQFDIKPILKYSGLLTISSGIAGVCGLIFIKLAFPTIKATLITQVIAILLAGSVSLLVFYIVCRLLGVNEVKDYVKRMVKR